MKLKTIKFTSRTFFYYFLMFYLYNTASHNVKEITIYNQDLLLQQKIGCIFSELAISNL